ncbi:hypothetical protein C8R42DRAFT_648418 [Lentinula raphanica]|nr:hypothetical protein C8R42DRAFT_648418 [Lentinula raphanica]
MLSMLMITQAVPTSGSGPSGQSTASSPPVDWEDFIETALGPPGNPRYPDWMQGPLSEFLRKNDKKVFRNKEELGSEWIIQPTNGHNAIAFSQRRPNEIIKYLTSADKDGFAEVKALKAAGLYIASGTNEEGYPFIRMKKLPGIPLIRTAQYQDASPEQRIQYIRDVLDLARPKIVKLALEQQLLFVDLNLGNLLVGATPPSDPDDFNGWVLEQPIRHVELIDLGAPGIFKIKKSVTGRQVKKWYKLIRDMELVHAAADFEIDFDRLEELVNVNVQKLKQKIGRTALSPPFPRI